MNTLKKLLRLRAWLLCWLCLQSCIDPANPNNNANNAANAAGHTPLQLAVQAGHSELVQALLSDGADITPRNAAGHTPLQLAVQAGHSELVQALLSQEAQITIRNEAEEPPLQVAEQRTPNALVEAFKNAGECPICQDKLSDCRQLPCGHVFHQGCIRTWFSTQAQKREPTTCPMCRAVIRP